MSVVAATNQPPSLQPRRLKIMVVDDSVVIRGLISRWIEAESDLEVVASVRTGRDAVNQVAKSDPDVAVLDIEMPDLDGIAALPLLLEKKRNLVIIMASTLTRRNAEISLKALSLGAADYIPKPETSRELTTVDTFRRDLLEKIRQLAPRARARARGIASAPAPAVVSQPAAPSRAPAGSVRLRAWSTAQPKILVIGSSTGGPQALMETVGAIAPHMDKFPVLITQHMPPTFTTILAEHIARVANRPAAEAVDGEKILPGRIYVAPGGKHMRAVMTQGSPAISLTEDAPINFCRPAVDPLFTSAVKVWGAHVLGVVLTGMGSDGAKGAADIVAAGGNIIAQDEASSVVWGMPGAAANAGICAAVLPLNQIGPKIVRVFAGERQ